MTDLGGFDNWFFVYAGYSHRYHMVSFYFLFPTDYNTYEGRMEKFSFPAKHFYSNYYSLILGNDAWNNAY